MPQNKFILFILVLLLILGGLGWYFFFRTSSPTTPSGDTTQNDDLFPFGDSTGTQTPGKTGGSGSSTIDLSGGQSGQAALPRLRKLSSDKV
ncbi:MAG: hypothetical protein WC767_03970, partial [Candidatus Paceibacterota bacterium]